jgi:lactoylglutathione lyase
MATPFLGLRTLIYHVKDLKEATAWYKGILGIEPYFDTPYYVGFNVGGYELGLHPDEKGLTTGDNAGVYWGVENVNETYQALLTAGATEWEEPSDVGGGIIVAAVKDPWGNVFGVIYNPHFTL